MFAVNNTGHTPLHQACLNRKWSVVVCLVAMYTTTCFGNDQETHSKHREGGQLFQKGEAGRHFSTASMVSKRTMKEMPTRAIETAILTARVGRRQAPNLAA
jgi:hypothetical protein